METVDAPCAWLTTVREDGSPHTTPVWFVLRHETLWVASAARNVKVANLSRNPLVSVAIDGSATSPWVAEGVAAVDPRIADRVEVLDAFSEKYDGWDAADEAHDGPRVLIQIEIDRWLLRAQ